MPWYSAHVIMAIRYKQGEQKRFPVYENVLLVEADNENLAMETAEKLAKEEEDLRDGLTLDGQEAFRDFMGIRKLISISNPIKYDDEERPESGAEVTYSLFEVGSEQDLVKLANGDEVSVTYAE